MLTAVFSIAGTIPPPSFHVSSFLADKNFSFSTKCPLYFKVRSFPCILTSAFLSLRMRHPFQNYPCPLLLFWLILLHHFEICLAILLLLHLQPLHLDLSCHAFLSVPQCLNTSGATITLCCCSVAKSCLTLCDPMDCSTPGFPVLQYLPEFSQIHVWRIGGAI